MYESLFSEHLNEMRVAYGRLSFGGKEWVKILGMTIGSRPNGYMQKFPAMGRVLPIK